MKRTIFSSQASVRNVLFTVLLILGGWGIFASLKEMNDSLDVYRQSRNLAKWSQVAAQLLTSAQHFAYERGRTAVVLRGQHPISAKDREFLGERRRLADASLNAALGSLQEFPDSGYPEILKQRENVHRLRHEVDTNTTISGASRDPGLIPRWFDGASSLIYSIQQTTDAMVAQFPVREVPQRLMRLAATVLELRITAGAGASAIAQAVSAEELPTPHQLSNIYILRGREDQLWNEVDRIVRHIKIEELQTQVMEVRNHHLAVFRPLQDQALSDLSARKTTSVPLEKLTSISLPTLDGISGLMTAATKISMRIANDSMISARATLIRHVVWFGAILLLLFLAIRYILRQVILPLEQLDRELHRIGALPEVDIVGDNELDRLKESTKSLEHSLVARAAAEAERERTIQELQKAIEQVKTLRGFLPICANCKKIRNDEGYWQQVETYITQHSDAQFSHSFCPDCVRVLYGDIIDRKRHELPE